MRADLPKPIRRRVHNHFLRITITFFQNVSISHELAFHVKRLDGSWPVPRHRIGSAPDQRLGSLLVCIQSVGILCKSPNANSPFEASPCALTSF
jgi:hypothetical protein